MRCQSFGDRVPRSPNYFADRRLAGECRGYGSPRSAAGSADPGLQP